MFKDFEEKQKLKSWYRKIWDKIYYKTWYIFDIFRYDIPNGVKNIINWIPIVWKHYDFDHTYIYDVLLFKIQLIYNSTKKYSYEIEEDKNIRLKDMALAISLLTKLRTHYYGEQYYPYYDSDIEFVPTDETNAWFTMESTVIKDNLMEYLNAHKLRLKDALKEHSEYKNMDTTDKRYSLAILVSQANTNKAKRLLFNLLTDKIETFWH